MMLTPLSCLVFITTPPVTDVHVMLKKIKCERRSLVDKTQPRKD